MGRLTPTEHKTEEQSQQELDELIVAHINKFSAYLAQSKTCKWDQARFDATQRQLIIDIIRCIANGQNVILQGSTGTGKSVVAMFCATFFKSYVLTSDKLLQDQYDKFIQQYLYDNNAKADTTTSAFRSCVMLKGRDNYICHVNGLPFSMGKCQQDGLSSKKALALPCGPKCAYLQTRQKAAAANCTVLNYAYWLIQVNCVKNLFGPRELTIFDECHKIDDILSGFLDTSIGPRFIQNCTKAESLIAGIMTLENQNKYVELRNNVFAQVKAVIKLATTQYDIATMRAEARVLAQQLSELVDFLHTAYEKLSELQDSGKQLGQFEKAFIRFVASCDTLSYSIITMLDATEQSPGDMLVVLDAATNSLQFKCVNDELLANTLVHHSDATHAQLWMSATIGDIDTFATLNGIKNYVAFYMEPDWDFSKSPIVLCRPALSLSYKNKAANMPRLVEKIDSILDTHDCNCIIHTSTRDIANYIINNSKHKRRMLTYVNAEDKQNKLAMLTDGTNYVLVGFSITEGVDLPDNRCRCQIVAKLPWQSLGDIVVKTKAANHESWYRNKCYQSFVQSVGRGIRHANDWCETFVIDESIRRIMPYIKHNQKLHSRFVIEQESTPQQDATDDDFFAGF